ncbi:MAG: glycosyltransferase family 2 protein [Gammaproteobacteria bacterium]|nr:MAG: glycosyltransferase family 2 protein [Gammaproteobacteria bacterium]UTW42489.1 glycosyltransferase family 2 protein [bacterium SCSIO 12844]
MKTIEIPNYTVKEYHKQKKKYCLCIPVINEGEKIKTQLKRMHKANISEYVDIIICDGGSDDQSLSEQLLLANGVSLLLTKCDTGKLSAQLRMGYYYALYQRTYDGIVTIDGNNKDSVEDIIMMAKKLAQGYDFIQGSRYMTNGKAINTPLIRHIAVKLIHIPVISLIAGYHFSDTTNGFRAYSKNYLLDQKVKPFREIFRSYELLAYLSVRAPQLGYKVTEIPVTRRYPEKGKIPTKISFIKGNFQLLKVLVNLLFKKYNP